MRNKERGGVSIVTVVATLIMMSFMADIMDVPNGLAVDPDNDNYPAGIRQSSERVLNKAGLSDIVMHMPPSLDEDYYYNIYATAYIYDDGAGDIYEIDEIVRNGTLERKEMINEFTTVEDWMENSVFFDNCFLYSPSLCDGPISEGEFAALVTMLHIYINRNIESGASVEALKTKRRPCSVLRGKRRSKKRCIRALKKIRILG